MTGRELFGFATTAESERNVLPRQRQPVERSDSEDGSSDAELLRMHVAGDPGAFGLLFRRHRDRLWAVAFRTLGDPEEAADALQDAMLAAFRRAGSFRGDSAVTTWLHRIVVNAALDRLRRPAARPTASSQDEEALDALATASRPAPDPWGSSDTAIDVRAALRQLVPEQQAAVVLVDMLAYSVADAAQVLGVSQGTVKSRAARGRARLLPRLEHLRHTGQRPLPTHAGPGCRRGLTWRSRPSQRSARRPGPATEVGRRDLPARRSTTAARRRWRPRESSATGARQADCASLRGDHVSCAHLGGPRSPILILPGDS